MSNHSGSYMLNEVLILLEKDKVFEFLGEEKKKTLVNNIMEIGYANDCNPGEILDVIGKKLGICYCCLEFTDKFDGKVCNNCVR